MNGATVSCLAYTSALTGPDALFNHVELVDASGAVVAAYHCAGGFDQVLSVPASSFPDLDPALIAGAVGAGFFVLLPLWAVIYGGRALISAIRF